MGKTMGGVITDHRVPLVIKSTFKLDDKLEDSSVFQFESDTQDIVTA